MPYEEQHLDARHRLYREATTAAMDKVEDEKNYWPLYVHF